MRVFSHQFMKVVKHSVAWRLSCDVHGCVINFESGRSCSRSAWRDHFTASWRELCAILWGTKNQLVLFASSDASLYHSCIVLLYDLLCTVRKSVQRIAAWRLGVGAWLASLSLALLLAYNPIRPFYSPINASAVCFHQFALDKLRLLVYPEQQYDLLMVLIGMTYPKLPNVVSKILLQVASGRWVKMFLRFTSRCLDWVHKTWMLLSQP